MEIKKINFKQGISRIYTTIILIILIPLGLMLFFDAPSKVNYSFEKNTYYIENGHEIPLKQKLQEMYNENIALDYPFLNCYAFEGYCNLNDIKLINSDKNIKYPSFINVIYYLIIEILKILFGLICAFGILRLIYTIFENMLCWIIKGFKAPK